MKPNLVVLLSAGLSEGGLSSATLKAQEDRSSCNKGWFWSLAVPVILIVGVSGHIACCQEGPGVV
jgi:hypothetical protein